MKEVRTRNWTCVVYPGSCVNDWRNILDDLHIEWVESPLHNQDLDANNNLKKAHIHLLLMFSGVKTYEQVLEITDSIKATIPQRVHNARSLVRYFAHLDNPDKHQYSVSEIISHGGVDLQELLRKSASERYSLISDMIAFIKEHKITEFQDLVDYSISEKFDSWFPLLCDNSSFVVNLYIKSQRHRYNRLST